jgi:hypothetical protein
LFCDTSKAGRGLTYCVEVVRRREDGRCGGSMTGQFR